ncbi:type 4a pilus biogenesis protein PilO [Actinoplanes sp. CA-051413]|uniref:type 4a pilus biogenesis protein PilO n=1 Tax=Actinoplanes sp. CA-051413 TaxID=3239899 RepID=UPI003D973625
MRTRHADRLWLIAGVAVVALLVLVTWLLLVGPQRTEAADLREQTGTTETQAAQLRARTAKLAAAQAQIGELTRQRNANTAALPTGSSVPAFLRQLQSSGTKVGVDVSGVTVGLPTAEKDVPGVWSLPIQLTAEGPVAKLGAFLDELQDSGQKRAVLIQTAGLSDEGGDAKGAARTMSLNLSLKAFVAPPAGAGAPIVTSD